MLPFGSIVNNAYWHADRSQWEDQLGEVSGAVRPWRNGKLPVQAAVMGPLHFCGTQEEWESGALLIDALSPDDYDLLGRPFCCNPAPPLSVRAGLQCRFRSRSVLRAELPAVGGIQSAPGSGGLLTTALEAVSSPALTTTGAGNLGAVLQAVVSVVADTLSSHSTPAALSASSGLLATPATSHSLPSFLAALGSLQADAGAASVLLAELAAIIGVDAALGPVQGLLAVLSGLSAPETDASAAAAASAVLSALAGLEGTLTAGGNMPAAVSLIATIQSLLEARGILLSDTEIAAALQAAAVGQPLTLDTAGGKLSLAVSFASFQLVTPTGSCGSLPANMVARFSGGTGSGTALDGAVINLTFSSGTWMGNTTVGGNTLGLSMGCNSSLHVWNGSLTGHWLSNTITFTGTSGPSPNLTGACTIISPSAGTTNITITRT